MRNRCRGTYLPAVASIIGRNYPRLLRLCTSDTGPARGAMDDADVLQETFLLTTHDPQCAAMATEEEIIARFLFRYRLVRFQTLRDEAQCKTIPYADYIRTVEYDGDR